MLAIMEILFKKDNHKHRGQNKIQSPHVKRQQIAQQIPYDRPGYPVKLVQKRDEKIVLSPVNTGWQGCGTVNGKSFIAQAKNEVPTLSA